MRKRRGVQALCESALNASDRARLRRSNDGVPALKVIDILKFTGASTKARPVSQGSAGGWDVLTVEQLQAILFTRQPSSVCRTWFSCRGRDHLTAEGRIGAKEIFSRLQAERSSRS
jgi:hypothetical protein